MKKILSIILTVIMCAALVSGCGSNKDKKETDPDKKTTEAVTETTASEFSDKADEEPGSVTEETLPEEPLSEEEQAAFDEILLTMILDYGYYPADAWPYVENHIEELKEISPGKGHRWELIMDYWRYTREELTVSYDSLPADIEDSSEVCIAVLGYKLYDDGKIRPELEQRLKLALKCAEENPHIQIICAGGGTARMNTQATEAGQMAEWLIKKGIEENRIMVEEGSKTTGQNAMFSYEIMSKHPEIRKVVIVTSDYHVPWGAVLYQGEMILNAADPDNPEMYVAGNAGCVIENPEIYPFTYQAAGLLELAGLNDTAMDIYMGRMDDPELK